jgi:predicted  nucleic acid-binding Zn-ribbon protein
MSAAMRREIDGMKSEMTDLKAMFRRTMLVVARMEGKIDSIEHGMSSMATKDDISALNARMDGFSGLLLDSRQRWAVHADTLKQHHDRLTKLEQRRA